MTDRVNVAGETISVGDHAFVVGGKPIGMYGAAVHYWRLDRDKWDFILQTVKDLGFRSVTSYIPWEAHELAPGRFDFGQEDPRKDIDGFISLLETKGMTFVARPGPQINSEMTFFGYPKRIVDDNRLHALNGRGTRTVLTQVPRPVPVLSYTEDAFFDEVAVWYDNIIPILARHAYPKGGLLAVQVDNEMAFFFAVNAYAADYSPSSVRAYQRFVEEKYGDLQTINRVYRANYGAVSEIDPPRRWEASRKEDVPYYTDWIQYRERYLIDSMKRLAGMMRERGLTTPLFHNYPHPLGPGGATSGFTTPFDLIGLEKELDFVGFDFYSKKHLYDHVKTIVSYLVGSSRLPYVPELGAGVWPWYLRPRDTSDEEFVAKATLMHGIKGFSRYTFVERDKWFDSPVRRDGRVRVANASMYARINRVLAETDYVNLRRRADVLLLANREYDRLEAASVLVSFPGDFLETPSSFSEYPNPMTVSEDDLGFRWPIQVENRERFNDAYAALRTAGLPYLISDTNLPVEQWSKARAVVLSTFDFMSAKLQSDLLSFVEGGGTAILGPDLPEFDEKINADTALRDAVAGLSGEVLAGEGSTASLLYRIGRGSLAVVRRGEDLVRALQVLAARGGWVRYSVSDQRLDVAIHEPQGGSGRLVLFVVNPTAETIVGQVDVGRRLSSVREVWDGVEVACDGSAISDRFPPYTIRIYESREA